MGSGGNRTAIAVRIICVLALLFLGLSHKMPIAAPPSDSLLLSQTYALPDGSAPDLCVPQPAGKLKISYPDCDACRLSASVILPEPPQVTPAEPAVARGTSLPARDASIAGTARLAALPRGPPGSVLS